MSIVTLSEDGLENLLLEVLPNIGYEQYGNVPSGCLELSKHISQIPQWFVDKMNKEGRVLKNNDYWPSVYNQITFSDTGRCDIFVSLYAKQYVASNNHEDSRSFKKAVIIELKKKTIDAKAANQVLKYKSHVEKLGVYDEVEAILIGTEVDDIDGIRNFIKDELSVWICRYNNEGLSISKTNSPHNIPFDVEEKRKKILTSIYNRATKHFGYEYNSIEELVSNDYILNQLHENG